VVALLVNVLAVNMVQSCYTQWLEKAHILKEQHIPDLAWFWASLSKPNPNFPANTTISRGHPNGSRSAAYQWMLDRHENFPAPGISKLSIVNCWKQLKSIINHTCGSTRLVCSS
jgi:hypothetical protein